MASNKKSIIKNHFFYNWYVYIIAIVGFSLITVWIANLKTRNQPYEMVTIFSGVPSIDTKKTTQVITENDPDKSLREVRILDYDPNDSSFGTILTSAGTYNTDIVIIPINKANESFCAQYMLDLTGYQSFIEQNIGTYNYVTIGEYNRKYAIEVYNEDTGVNLLSKFIKYKADGYTYKQYGLFINQRSQSFYPMVKVDINSSSHGLTALKNLLQYEE